MQPPCSRPAGVWRVVIVQAAAALKRDWLLFVPGGLFYALLVWLSGKALMFFPVGWSFMLCAALFSLGLSPDKTHSGSGFYWWFMRIIFFWLSLLLLFAMLILLLLIIVFAALFFVERGTLTHQPNLSIVSTLYAFCALLLLWRLWPQFAAPFLVEGKQWYEWPWHKWAIVYWEGPYWLGPSLIRTWRWTGRKNVRRLASPPALAAVGLLLLTALLPVWARAALPGIVSFAAALGAAAAAAFAALVLGQCTWAAVLLSGETPLVVQPERLELDVPELIKLRQMHSRERILINRFPDGREDYVTLLFPTELIAGRKEGLQNDIREIGALSSQHNGEYFTVWDTLSDMQNDSNPVLYLDFQGAMLAVIVLERRSAAFGKFWRLLQRWRAEFPVVGEFY